jgi:hypothetical protein
MHVQGVVMPRRMAQKRVCVSRGPQAAICKNMGLTPLLQVAWSAIAAGRGPCTSSAGAGTFPTAVGTAAQPN